MTPLPQPAGLAVGVAAVAADGVAVVALLAGGDDAVAAARERAVGVAAVAAAEVAVVALLAARSTMPLPHSVGLQLASQPSPSTTLPSSHCSPTVTMPLPQRVSVQLTSQPSPSMQVAVVALLAGR